MRTAFINQLIKEAEANENIFLLVGDLGYSVVESFQQKFPDRFINTGVAEQNMAGIAAGLAREGYCVYIYSIGNFPTLRCMEQIRYDICYHNLNVKIVAVGGGFAYGALGASHHATEEFGMLRIIPNLTVCAPGDPWETRAITSFSATYNGPCYIRIGKAGEPDVHTGPLSFNRGDIIQVLKGKRTAVFTTGAMLKYAFDFIRSNGLEAALYSFPFIKPVNKEKLAEILPAYKKIITLEEHQANGGFGSALLEIINDLENEKKISKIPDIKRIAIPDEFYSVSGSQEYLRTQAKLVLSMNDFI